MATSPCPACQGDDPALAAKAWRPDAEGLDESHLHLTRQRCDACGARALRIWTELIDWSGGDDSQATLIVPLPPGMESDPSIIADEAAAAACLARIGACRHLVRSLPRGYDGPASWIWSTGEPVILPHD